MTSFNRFLIATATAVLSAPLCQFSAADTLRIPLGQQHHQQMVRKPGLGLSMAAVENQFGTPLEKLAARGEPPISRWVYRDFIVYFEHDTVIHSVTKHRAKQN